MNKKLIYSVTALALIFFLVALFIFLNSKNDAKKKNLDNLPVTTAQEEQKSRVIQQVKIFFLTEDPSFLKPVVFDIERPVIYQDIYWRFAELLLKGSENAITPVPEGVTIRSLYYLEEKKILVIDFSEELLNRFPPGSTSELEFIYFIVNNFCSNFKEIKAIKFLIGGNEYGELTGHIDIGNPFYPNDNYLKDSLE